MRTPLHPQLCRRDGDGGVRAGEGWEVGAASASVSPRLGGLQEAREGAAWLS